MVFSAFVTPATPRTPAGGRACGTPSPMGGLLFRPRLVRRCARIRATSAAYVRKFYWKLPHKNLPWLVLPAPSGPRAKKKAQTTAPARVPVCDGDGEPRPILANAVPLASDRQCLGHLKETQTGNYPDRAVEFCGFCHLGPVLRVVGGRQAGGRMFVLRSLRFLRGVSVGASGDAERHRVDSEHRQRTRTAHGGRAGLLLERPCCTRTKTRHMTSASIIAVRFLPSLFLCGLVTFDFAVLCGCGRSLLTLAISHTDLPLWVWVLRALHISVGYGVGYATFDYAAFDYATFDYAGGAV